MILPSSSEKRAALCEALCNIDSVGRKREFTVNENTTKYMQVSRTTIVNYNTIQIQNYSY